LLSTQSRSSLEIVIVVLTRGKRTQTSCQVSYCLLFIALIVEGRIEYGFISTLNTNTYLTSMDLTNLQKILRIASGILAFSAVMDFSLWILQGYLVPSWTIATLSLALAALLEILVRLGGK